MQKLDSVYPQLTVSEEVGKSITVGYSSEETALHFIHVIFKSFYILLIYFDSMMIYVCL